MTSVCHTINHCATDWRWVGESVGTEIAVIMSCLNSHFPSFAYYYKSCVYALLRWCLWSSLSIPLDKKSITRWRSGGSRWKLSPLKTSLWLVFHENHFATTLQPPGFSFVPFAIWNWCCVISMQALVMEFSFSVSIYDQTENRSEMSSSCRIYFIFVLSEAMWVIALTLTLT